MTASTTTELPVGLERTDDVPRFAHYVDKEKIVDAMVLGFSLMTLCGMMLRPGRANPEKLPICPTCKTQFDSIRRIMNSN